MLTDIGLKSELSNRFRDSPESDGCIETTAMVLTTVVWPMSASTTFDVPRELQFAMDKFTQFYQRQHNGRRLAYLLLNCRGELVSNCFARRYTFVVSLNLITE